MTQFNACFYAPSPLIHPDSHQVFSQANTPLKKWLLDFAYSRKEAELKNGLVRQDSIWDKLIFKKVQVSKACCRNVTSAVVTFCTGVKVWTLW